ncbi:hypothetical protein SAMN05661093_10751 [Kibdelosporangium aridum]|uniref:Exosortase/archaeosortase family protein n=1 Tax=Kibdelosporangium aridum TaxID=2030 RepID=A0A1W2FZE4_KIBAR|nr:hypothetical protein SAMN05661093_10751 [Kibdelosporangium aridum]
MSSTTREQPRYRSSVGRSPAFLDLTVKSYVDETGWQLLYPVTQNARPNGGGPIARRACFYDSLIEPGSRNNPVSGLRRDTRAGHLPVTSSFDRPTSVVTLHLRSAFPTRGSDVVPNASFPRSQRHLRSAHVAMAEGACRARLATVPAAIALSYAPWWWSSLDVWPPAGPFGALALVPVLAALVGWHGLRSAPRGPQIHDRQLDLIICFLATVSAVVLLVLAPQHTASGAYALVPCLMAVAIIAAGYGSRALWQVRWAVVLLVLAWRAPWAVLADQVSPQATAAGLHLSVLLMPSASLGVSDRMTSVLRVPHSGDFVTLDPAAGAGMLLLLYVGMLCGVGWSFCVVGAMRRIGAVVSGTAIGTVLAAVEWTCTMWRARSVGPIATVEWASGGIHRFTAVTIAVVALVAFGVRLLRKGHPRRQVDRNGGTEAGVARRLAEAVPHACVGTVVVAVLAVAFLVLGVVK